MFTGIIEDVSVIRSAASNKLALDTKLDGIKTGDSVSVDGVCLTVTRIDSKKGKSAVYFDFSPETISKTTISRMKAGSKVNIERALKVGDRLGGHFVTGHIEAVGSIFSRVKKGNSMILDVSLPDNLGRYVINKGSVAIDGVSLTVVSSARGYVTVSVIPHTFAKTSLLSKKIGDKVNIETDVMAKYAENIFNESQRSSLTMEKLKKNGFI